MKKIIKDIIILAIAIAWFGSLSSLISCTRKLSQSSSKDSSYVETVKDTTVSAPGAKAETSINIDSINALNNGQWYEYFDSLNRISIAYMKDKFGKLNLKAQSKAAEFHFPIKTKTYVIRENHHTTNTVSKTPIWAWLLIGGLGTLLLAIFIGKALKRLGE